MEEREEVSHSRTWMEELDLAMAWRSSLAPEEKERVQARTVLDLLEEIWRTNSRPRPRLAPGGGVSVDQGGAVLTKSLEGDLKSGVGRLRCDSCFCDGVLKLEDWMIGKLTCDEVVRHDVR